MRANFKNLPFALVMLAAILSVLAAVDRSNIGVQTSVADTCVRVTVLDLYGNVVPDAEVKVYDESFLTDGNGASSSIKIAKLINSYDDSITEWYTVNLVIIKDGYVPTVMFNCIVYRGKTRNISVKIYPEDASDLPYVSYVESPPDDYVREIIK